MKELLDYVNDRVIVSEQLKNTSSFLALRKRDNTKNADNYYKELSYMFFVYSRKSIYFDLEILDRKKLVCHDQLKIDAGDYEKFDTDLVFKECLSLYDELQYSKQERLLNGIDEKIDEYLDFYRKTKIAEDTHEMVAKAMKSSSELLDLREKIEKKVLNEKATRQQGGGQSKMFE